MVEDNIIIALDTEESLKSIGVGSVDIASHTEAALAAIADNPPDFAIVDFNLGDTSSLAVTEELARRAIPFVLATGYSEMSEESGRLGAIGIVRKPYGREEIEQALQLRKQV